MYNIKQIELKLKFFINGFIIYGNNIEIWINSIKSLSFFYYLKNDSKFQYKTLVDIIGVDYYQKKKQKIRFFVYYQLLSILYFSRITILILSNELNTVKSIVSCYNAANWMEREVYDLMGIQFIGNFDLRRILTDYGFYGFPLRKDFPLTGYFEYFFSELNKKIKKNAISLTQEYRLFSFNSNKLEFKLYFDILDIDWKNYRFESEEEERSYDIRYGDWIIDHVYLPEYYIIRLKNYDYLRTWSPIRDRELKELEIYYKFFSDVPTPSELFVYHLQDTNNIFNYQFLKNIFKMLAKFIYEFNLFWQQLLEEVWSFLFPFLNSFFNFYLENLLRYDFFIEIYVIIYLQCSYIVGKLLVIYILPKFFWYFYSKFKKYFLIFIFFIYYFILKNENYFSYILKCYYFLLESFIVYDIFDIFFLILILILLYLLPKWYLFWLFFFRKFNYKKLYFYFNFNIYLKVLFDHVIDGTNSFRILFE